MVHSSYLRLACFSMLALLTALVVSNIAVDAESMKLSAIVHETPSSGYVFTALVPLPKMMPDSPLVATSPTPVSPMVSASPVPSTTLDVKKKP